MLASEITQIPIFCDSQHKERPSDTGPILCGAPTPAQGHQSDVKRHLKELRSDGKIHRLIIRRWYITLYSIERVRSRLIRNFAQPELSAPARNYQFKVEQWDQSEDHIIWLIAVSNNFLVARAAYEAAVKYNPRERWLLRDDSRR
jgi:hypothetical protein